MGTQTIEDVMSKLPKTVKLIHAEVVLRNDLRKRFMDMQCKIRQATSMGINDRRAKDAAWDKYGREEIVFHGTLRQNVGSIVRNGFIVPGQKTSNGETIGVRCGSTWGQVNTFPLRESASYSTFTQGIYTSPDPNFSLGWLFQMQLEMMFVFTIHLYSYTDYTAGGVNKGRTRLLPGQKLVRLSPLSQYFMLGSLFLRRLCVLS